MKKWVLGFFIFILLVGVGLYVSAGIFLDKASRLVLGYMSERAVEFGAEITEVGFKSVSLGLPASIVWKDITIKGRRLSERALPSGTSLSFSVQKIAVHLVDFRNHLFRLEAREINAVLARSSQRDEDKLIGDEFETQFQFDVTRPNEAFASALTVARDLAQLLAYGRCATFVRFTGHVTFTFNEKFFDTDFSVERREDESVLTLDRGDLREISRELTEELTNEEIEILAENPLKAPNLLRITKEAYRRAEDVSERNPNVSEDAYRHVLWSYLLTNAYGPEFAKRLTDAHERGGLYEIEADHVMDLNNNAIGRNYALQGYEESSLPALVAEDPSVVRSTSQIES